MDAHEIEQTLTEQGKILAQQGEQIKTLFNQQKCLSDLTQSVATLAVKMENVEKGQSKIEDGLEELKSAPAKKWQMVVAAIISSVVGGIIGMVITLICK